MYLKRSAVVLLALIVLAAFVPAQSPDAVKLPDTAAGKTLAAFLTAFNTGDIQALRRFHSERGADEGNAEEDLNFFKQCEGLKLNKVLKSSDYEIEVLAQA